MKEFLVMAAVAIMTVMSAQAQKIDDASQFVNITDVVPDAILEVRYFGTYNFVGTRIDGYEEPTALLTKQAAAALKAVSDDVKAQGYRLKIYDAYRPQKGVDHFVRWAENIPDTLMKAYFYPDLDKSVLFPQDYICLKSGHTRGSTVDLTLFDMATEKELDMGGTFDWFGPESHPDFCGNPKTGEYTGDNSKSPTGRSITAEQFQNRMILRQAMLRHGFKSFDTEWWHFTLKDEPFPNTYFTFPVASLTCCKAHNDNTAQAVKSVELIRTDKSWDGVELPDYLKGRPELVAVKYEFPAGKKLGWHHHPVMNYGILVQGELTIIGLDGNEKVVHEGEAVVEMVGTIHHGENRGTKPVILYMFYLSQKDLPLAVQHLEIPLE